MLTRVRLEARGASATEVELILYPHAEHIERLLNVTVGRGECVIERDRAEPDGPFAWKGRLVLHPDMSDEPLTLAQRAEEDERHRVLEDVAALKQRGVAG